jgi:glycosyltransferase involved in cell wall biosynthesis
LIKRIQPDVIVSGMAHLNVLVLLLRPFIPRKTRVVVRQNGLLSVASVANNALLSRLLYKALYPRADRILCQTAQMAAEFATHLRSAKKFEILPNPVEIRALHNQANQWHWQGPEPHLLAVGRLSREKGFDLAIQAFAAVRARFPFADMTILGCGPEETSLKALRDRLGLTTAVHLPGYVANPAEWFDGATLFVSSARQDALPNALLEAAAAGLPIVAAPASGGIPDLLRDKPGTWLANHVASQSLADCLCTALETIQPGQRFAHSWIEPFRLEHVIARYEKLIDEVLCEKS